MTGILAALALGLFQYNVVDYDQGTQYCVYDVTGARYVVTIPMSHVCPPTIEV
jgi:hypothetical protein